jgi:hypothetical protein
MAHYEIERADPDIGLYVEPEQWHVVNVSDANPVPTPLRFDALEHALAYTFWNSTMLRIVQVADDGERVPVDTSAP